MSIVVVLAILADIVDADLNTTTCCGIAGRVPSPGCGANGQRWGLLALALASWQVSIQTVQTAAAHVAKTSRPISVGHTVVLVCCTTHLECCMLEVFGSGAS